MFGFTFTAWRHTVARASAKKGESRLRCELPTVNFFLPLTLLLLDPPSSLIINNPA